MQMLIGGTLRDSRDHAVLDVMNPATGEKIDSVPFATQEDIEEAIDLAVSGQKEWASLPVWKRGEIIKRFTQLVLEESTHKELAELHCKESGKTYREAYAEITRACELFLAFVDRSKHLYQSVVPAGLEPGHDHTLQIVVREPLGVVVCIVPYNYPVSLMAHKVAPALVAGNAALIKPASDTPLTTLRLCRLMVEAGVTPGAVQVVTGAGGQIGRWLVDNPKIAKVSLTGSTPVGKLTASYAAPHLIPCTFELGGNDPFIVMDDGDVDLAVNLILTSRLRNAGQICCSSKRLFVHQKVYAEFLEKLEKLVKNVVVGDPMSPETTMGCLINERAAIKVEEQIQLTVRQGATLHCGGQRNGAFLQPAILTGVTEEMDIARDMEVFGPVLPIITFTELSEAVRMANLSNYGLSSAIITRSMEHAIYAAKNLDAGGVVINGGCNAHPTEQPFGGHKSSGLGNEGVMSALDSMTQIKTIILYNMV